MSENMGRITRRSFLKIGAAGALYAAVPFGTGASLFASEQKTAKIGILAPSHCALPVIYAQIQGEFKNNGVDAELVYKKTSKEIAMGILSGELDFGQVISPVVYAMQLGIGPFKGKNQDVVSPNWVGTDGGCLVVKAGSSIKKASDLKGKKIGVHSPLMFHNILIKEVFRQSGIDPEKDLAMETITMDKIVGALAKGEIDAFINPEPLCTVAIEKGIAEQMLTTQSLWNNHPCCVLTALKKTLDENENLVKDVSRAAIASASALDNPENRPALIQQIRDQNEMYQKLPLELLQKAFAPGRSDFGPFPYQSSTKTVAKLMKKSSLMPEDADIDKLSSDIFLSDFARARMQELAISDIPASNDRPEELHENILA